MELGNGFSFIGNQYKISIDDKDYFIDMLFYHTKLHCYIVVELKNTEYKQEYAGKLNFYLSAVDDLIKTDSDNPTIYKRNSKNKILCKISRWLFTFPSIKKIFTILFRRNQENFI